MERAGFTDVLLTGMLMRWIRVSVSPMTMGATAAYAFWPVTARMTVTKTAVRITSTSSTAPRPKPPGDASPKPLDAKPASWADAR